MTFQEVKTPEQLMLYLDQNFKYGVVDSNGEKYFDSSDQKFQNICNNQWKLRSVQDLLNVGIGHCYDQVEIEREWFTLNNYEILTFWISAYQPEVENSGFSHTYLLYKENEIWNLFEHADFYNKGIYKFKSIKDAVKWQANKQIKFAESCVKPQKKYVTCIKQYEKPPTNINMQGYINFISNSKDYNI